MFQFNFKVNSNETNGKILAEVCYLAFFSLSLFRFGIISRREREKIYREDKIRDCFLQSLKTVRKLGITTV